MRIYVNIRICMSTNVYKWNNVYIWICICINMYIYSYMNIFLLISIYIYICKLDLFHEPESKHQGCAVQKRPAKLIPSKIVVYEVRTCTEMSRKECSESCPEVYRNVQKCVVDTSTSAQISTEIQKCTEIRRHILKQNVQKCAERSCIHVQKSVQPRPKQLS